MQGWFQYPFFLNSPPLLRSLLFSSKCIYDPPISFLSPVSFTSTSFSDLNVPPLLLYDYSSIKILFVGSLEVKGFSSQGCGKIWSW